MMRESGLFKKKEKKLCQGSLQKKRKKKGKGKDRPGGSRIKGGGGRNWVKSEKPGLQTTLVRTTPRSDAVNLTLESRLILQRKKREKHSRQSVKGDERGGSL